jgi:hypothetical protein
VLISSSANSLLFDHSPSRTTLNPSSRFAGLIFLVSYLTKSSKLRMPSTEQPSGSDQSSTEEQNLSGGQPEEPQDKTFPDPSTNELFQQSITEPGSLTDPAVEELLRKK